MTRKSIRSFIVAGFAAASMMTFSAPVYAGTADQGSAQAEQGWCNIVPTFCGNQCNNTARCVPCKPGATGAMDRNDQMGNGCPNVANRE